MRYAALVFLTLAVGAGDLLAQQPQATQRSTAGPRLGLTYVAGSRSQALLREYDINPVMTQFGWHSEQEVFPSATGPSLVVEEIVLLGGLEQQTVVPSLTMMMGVRLPSGVEFGIGPNVSPMGTALGVSVGKSLRYGGVSLPINLAFVSSPGSLRTTILVGYAVETRDHH